MKNETPINVRRASVGSRADLNQHKMAQKDEILHELLYGYRPTTTKNDLSQNRHARSQQLLNKNNTDIRVLTPKFETNIPINNNEKKDESKYAYF